MRRTLFTILSALVVLLGSPACTGTNAGLIQVNGYVGIRARHLEITLLDRASGHRDYITAPVTEGAPIQFPTSVSFAFPDSLEGDIAVRVLAYDGTTEVAWGDAVQKIVSGGVTTIDVTLQPGLPPN